MRCDLHLHSRHSGPADPAPLGAVALESYSDPRALYGLARRRGMDLVTLTDHDAIDGGLEIASLPGTFLSEEVTCTLPGGRQVHLGVFGIDEARHAGIARRRQDGEALLAYLAEQRVPACLNHPFSALTGPRETADLLWAMARLPLVEGLNGAMSERVNAAAGQTARSLGLPMVGGSDAHTLASVARSWTEVPGARAAGEFLEGLRAGLCVPRGSSGSYARLTGDVARIAALAFRDQARQACTGAVGKLLLMLALSPLMLALPVVTGVLFAREQAFARRLLRSVGTGGDRTPASRTGQRWSPAGVAP